MHSKISLYGNVILMSALCCLPLKLLDCFLLSEFVSYSCFWISHFSSVPLHSCSVVFFWHFWVAHVIHPWQEHLPERMKDIVMKITFSGNSSCQCKCVPASKWAYGFTGPTVTNDKNLSSLVKFFMGWENSAGNCSCPMSVHQWRQKHYKLDPYKNSLGAHFQTILLDLQEFGFIYLVL